MAQSDPKPIAFMVMPYGRRDILGAGENAPPNVDFDALWTKAYAPALRELGYEAIRADADLGGLIIKDMLERIVLAHLVLADITLANANVFYEVGVRHAAERTGCVMIAASWANVPFDLEQVPHLKFALDEGAISDATADSIRRHLVARIEELKKGTSPVHDSVAGYPDRPGPDAHSAFRRFVEDMASFEARVSSVRQAPPSQRSARARDLAAKTASADVIPGVAVELAALLRDLANWTDVVEFIDARPDPIKELPVLVEMQLLALAKSGNPREAIESLTALMNLKGRTEEREGLIGGRYKELMRDHPEDAEHYRDLAIKHYQAGADLDLNQYYAASNLPRLYRARGEPGDEPLATQAASITYHAARRRLAMNPDDEWVRPTLLGAAFDSGDIEQARRLVEEISQQDVAKWKLEATLNDLKDSIALNGDAEVRTALTTEYEKLAALI